MADRSFWISTRKTQAVGFLCVADLNCCYNEWQQWVQEEDTFVARHVQRIAKTDFR